DGPANPEKKSITWLECEHAWKVTKKEVLAFLVDPAYAWPLDWRENYRLITETGKRGIKNQVRRHEKKLEKVKQELSKYVRPAFTDAASVRALVSEALSAWRQRHPGIATVVHHDPDTYLRTLEDDTRQIRIKGLKTTRAEPYFFGIDEIYIPLTTLAPHERSPDSTIHDVDQPRRSIVLEQALSQRKVVIVGDPGSGKSTFLRRLAFELCRAIR